MSAIIHLMGRVTKDPVMQQGRNNGTEYISLDLATSQRSQNAQNNPENPYESVFYQCYLNKHLAERLIKAGVKKGTCLYIYGELELHPFVYSQGQRSGQAGSGAKINVRDWQFYLSNKSEGDTSMFCPILTVLFIFSYFVNSLLTLYSIIQNLRSLIKQIFSFSFSIFWHPL